MIVTSEKQRVDRRSVSHGTVNVLIFIYLSAVLYVIIIFCHCLRNYSNEIDMFARC